MILCDIGNTSADLLYPDGSRTKILQNAFVPESVGRNVHYVSVNRDVDHERLRALGWINVAERIDWSRYYPTMGVDRIMVCEAVPNGVIVDAGSAITVDVMEEGRFCGGFIALGLRAVQEAYARLSPALDVSWNFEVDLDTIPKNTVDAVSAGYLAPLVHEIQRYGKPVYVTGGDARTMAGVIGGCIVDDRLVFAGMLKLIEQ